MGWFTGIMVFIILWWLIFFTMLPTGVKTAHEAGEEAGEGHATSAPVKPEMRRKLLMTTGLTIVLFLLYWGIESSGLISLKPDFGR